MAVRADGDPATALSRALEQAPVAAARRQAEQLLRLDDDALRETMAALPREEAARLVAAAPGLEAKSRLLWRLDRAGRAAALDRLSGPLIAALIQNLEEPNLPLLGDLSLEQFQRLMDLCSPARRYPWLRWALALDDARANALPLLLPTRDLAETLLTRIEFRDHVEAIAAYPIENARLPPEALADPAQALLDLFGSGLLREIPVPDPGLEALLQRILDYDPDRYADLVRLSLRSLQYARDHAEEEEAIREAPILLSSLGATHRNRNRSRLDESTGVDRWNSASDLDIDPDYDTQRQTPNAHGPAPNAVALAPAESILPSGMLGILPRLARGLPAERRAAVAGELQSLALREAVAAGGSFAIADLEPVVKRVEALLLMGLDAERGDGTDTAVLAARPLRAIIETGARQVERLRQLALRLRPLDEVYDAGQRALLEAVLRPNVTLDPSGLPGLVAPAAAVVSVAHSAILSLEEIRAGLESIAVWAAIARALTLRRTAAAMAAARDHHAVLASLALGAALYGRIELGLAEAADLRRFAKRYLTPRHRVRAAARAALRRALEPWAVAHRLPLDATQAALVIGLEQLAQASRDGELDAGAARRWLYLE